MTPLKKTKTKKHHKTIPGNCGEGEKVNGKTTASSQQTQLPTKLLGVQGPAEELTVTLSWHLNKKARALSTRLHLRMQPR